MWLRLVGVEKVNSWEGSQCTYACCPANCIAIMLLSKKVSLCSTLKPCWAPLGCPNLKRTCNSLQHLRSLLQNPTLDDLMTWWKKLIRFAVYSTNKTPEIEAPSNMTDWQRCSWGPSNQNLTCLSKVPSARCPCHSLHFMKVMNDNERKSQNHHTSSCYGNFPAIPSTSQLTFRAEACWVHHNKECLSKPIVVWPFSGQRWYQQHH